MALFLALGLVLGNSAYKYLSVSYIQMMKSILPLPTLLVSFMLGREKKVNYLTVILVLVIVVGALIASLGELHFNIWGFGLQMAAIFADVCRMAMLDKLTLTVKLDNLSTIYYQAPLAGAFM